MVNEWGRGEVGASTLCIIYSPYAMINYLDKWKSDDFKLYVCMNPGMIFLNTPTEPSSIHIFIQMIEYFVVPQIQIFV